MTRHVYQCPLRWSDMDAFGHVNNVTFLTYLEEARVDLLLNAGGPVGAQMLATGVVIARHEVDYRRPLVHRMAPVSIEVWASEIRASSFHIGYRVVDSAEAGGDTEDILYIEAESVLVPYDLTGQSVRRLTDGEREFLERYCE